MTDTKHAPNNRAVPMDIEWNDAAIMTGFQNSPHVVRGHVSNLGLNPPTVLAIYQWVSRGRIPERWRPLLIYVLLREQKLSINEMFRRGRRLNEPKSAPAA
jgi:hypothetical protein